MIGNGTDYYIDTAWTWPDLGRKSGSDGDEAILMQEIKKKLKKL